MKNIPAGLGWATYFEMNHADHNQLYARGPNGLSRTLDAGESWTWTGSNIRDIYNMVIEDKKDPMIYCSSYKTLYRIYDAASRDSSLPADDFSSQIPYQIEIYFISNLSYSPHDKNKMFVSVGSFSNYGVFEVSGIRSWNLKWKDLTGNLPNSMPVNSVIQDPGNPNYLYIGTDFGFYYSPDYGETWIKENGIPNVTISELQIRQSDRTIFVISGGRGAWRVKLSDNISDIKKPSETQSNITIYPNPVVDKLRVSSGIEFISAVIQIIDNNGKILLNQKIHSTEEIIDVSCIKNGIYHVIVTGKKGKVIKTFIKY